MTASAHGKPEEDSVSQRATQLSTDDFLRDGLAHVQFVAQKIQRTIPVHVDLDELIGEGTLGLVQAARRFDAKRGIRFRTFAERRIVGAIQDSLRKLDPLGRTLRRQRRRAEQVVAELQSELARPPTDEEIAARLQLPLERWRSLVLQLARAGSPVDCCCPANPRGANGEPPEATRRLDDNVHDQQLRTILNDALATLPNHCCQIVTLRYVEGWTMTEISQALGISQCWVSKLHARTLDCIRQDLTRRGYTRSALLG